MSTKAARGTKRTCQNPECGSRFYDLKRDPIVCPICQSVYKLASAPEAVASAVEEKAARKPKKPEVADVVVDAPVAEVEGEEDLGDLEVAEEPIAAEEAETFLEEEEEGGDVSNIIGGPVPEGEPDV